MTDFYIKTIDGVESITTLRLRGKADGLKRRGVKYERQAEEMGVHPSTFTGYRKGSNLPTADSLRQMALYYGVSADWLLGIEGR